MFRHCRGPLKHNFQDKSVPKYNFGTRRNGVLGRFRRCLRSAGRAEAWLLLKRRHAPLLAYSLGQAEVDGLFDDRMFLYGTRAQRPQVGDNAFDERFGNGCAGRHEHAVDIIEPGIFDRFSARNEMAVLGAALANLGQPL